MRTCLVAIALTLTGAHHAAAQAPPRAAFDVASVRPATRGIPSSQRLTETRLDLINTPLGQILAIAFRADRHELSAPASLNTVRFDINATFPAGSRNRVPEMLQTLLVERFGLVTHVESRAIPAYELVAAKGRLTMKEVEASNEVVGFNGNLAYRSNGYAGTRLYPGLDRQASVTSGQPAKPIGPRASVPWTDREAHWTDPRQ